MANPFGSKNVIAILFLCGCAVVFPDRNNRVIPEADRPSLRVQISHTAHLQCCYSSSVGPLNSTWISTLNLGNGITIPREINSSHPRATFKTDKTVEERWCQHLTLSMVRLEDAGLYHCHLTHSPQRVSEYTHGTFLQVYRPMEKFFNISENVKNRILVAEGVLLLVCALLPGAILLYRAKTVNQLEVRTTKKEEENIYEGLNVDECSTAYDQIQRSQVPGTYQEIGYRIKEMDEEEEIQLEKP